MEPYIRVLGLLSVFWLLILCVGCSSVTVKQPLPRKASPSELAAFEGEWVSEGQIVFMRFDDGGMGHFAGVDWKEGKFRLDEGEFTVSKGAEKGFLSARVMENGKWSEGYYVAQYRFTDEGDLILWLPDVGAFADVVDKGKLDGVVEKGTQSRSVVITSPPEKVLAFLNDPVNGTLFDYREPMIIKRLLLTPPSREEEPPTLPDTP
jgi:hypothetical protein